MLAPFYWWGGAKSVADQTGRSVLMDVARKMQRQNSLAASTNSAKYTVSIWLRPTNPPAGATNGVFLFGRVASTDDWMQWEAPLTNSWVFAFVFNAVTRVRFLHNSYDPTEWQHLVMNFDNSLVGAARIRFWVNGVEITEFTLDQRATIPATPHRYTAPDAIVVIGSSFNEALSALTYLHYPVLIDGQALLPDSFAYQDTNGRWMPRQFSGNVGVHGCIMDFATDANIGADISGHGNFTLTAVGTDQIYTDTPQKNYPLHPNEGLLLPTTFYTIERLSANPGTSLASVIYSHILRTGKWFWEVKPALVQNTTAPLIGVCAANGEKSPTVGLLGNGQYWDGAAASAYVGAAWLAGETIGVELDLQATPKTIRFFAGGVWRGLKNLDASIDYWQPVCRYNTLANQRLLANFGAKAFTVAKPGDAKEVNSLNQEVPAQPDLYFDSFTYTGNGAASREFKELKFAPDLVWIKRREAVAAFVYMDRLVSGDIPNGYAPGNGAGGWLADATVNNGFTAAGFKVGSNALVNAVGGKYVAYCWKATPAAGFQTLKYSGNGVAGQPIAHNLGKRPDLVIVKRLDAAGDLVVHEVGGDAFAGTMSNYLLNTSAARFVSNAGWNKMPDANNFYPGTGVDVNANGGFYQAWVFTGVPGVSRFGMYQQAFNRGGTLILGFRPGLTVGRVSQAANWLVWDHLRAGATGISSQLILNSTAAEVSTQLDVMNYAAGAMLWGGGTTGSPLTFAWNWAAALHKLGRAVPPGVPQLPLYP